MGHVSVKRFLLRREVDETGISGTGIVAEGCEFSSGVVALTWISTHVPASHSWYASIAAVDQVHGHNGKTRIEFLD